MPDSYKFAVSVVQHERAGKTFADHIQSGAFAMGNPDTVIQVLWMHEGTVFPRMAWVASVDEGINAIRG